MTKAVVAVLVVLLAGAYVVFRVTGNVNDRAFEPAACQIWGGTWSPWSDWHCY